MSNNINKTGLVKEMREIREQLSNEILNMTFKQEKMFIQNQLRNLKHQKHITPNHSEVQSVVKKNV